MNLLDRKLLWEVTFINSYNSSKEDGNTNVILIVDVPISDEIVCPSLFYL